MTKALEIAAAILALALCASASAAEKLVTPSFKVSIDILCKEGVLGCDNVRYTGVNRKSGRSIALRGREVHRKCADGVTPCRFLHYEFRSGDIVYIVSEAGYLSVHQGSRQLVGEQGKWQ